MTAIQSEPARTVVPASPHPARRAASTPATLRQRLPAVLRRELLPVLSRSAAVAAVGLLAEFALRRAIGAAVTPVRRSATVVTRRVVTEIIVVERTHRRT